MSNAKGTRSKVLARLTQSEMFKLADIVKEEYTASGLDNVEFCEMVNLNPVHSAKFRFPLNKSHIATICESLDIPNNRQHKSRTDSVGDCLALTARVQALEDQLAKLTNFLITKGYHK
jgi:hypothetical protein